MSKNLSAVIVASRTHRHLKTPVPLLPFGDATVLGKTIEAYLGAGFDEVLVVLGYKAAEVEASLAPQAGRIRTVTSPFPDEEFAGLVRRGLDQLAPGTQAFALGLGNQPLLEAAQLSTLVSTYESKKPRILIPVWQGSLGYPAIFHVNLADEFRSLPSAGETWDVVKNHGADVLDLEVGSTSFVRYIEDMEDYHELLALAGLPIPPPIHEPGGNGAVPQVSAVPAAVPPPPPAESFGNQPRGDSPGEP